MLYLNLILSLIATAKPSPHAPRVPQHVAHAARPLITPAPRRSLKDRDEPSHSVVYPVIVGECDNFAEPEAGGLSGCQCSGWKGFLPFLTSLGSQNCLYSTIESYIAPPTITNTFDTYADYPYTMTLPNRAVVAYASTTKYNDDWSGIGSSTQIQAGMQMIVNMNGSESANVGTLTGGALYTSVSNALVSACPSPSDSSTITGCSEDATITGLTYVDDFKNVQNDGELDIKFDWVSYHDGEAFEGLVRSVAQVMNDSSLQPNNTSPSEYCFADGDAVTPVNICTDETPPGDWPILNVTSVPGMVQAIFTEQDAYTQGKVVVQYLQVSFSLKAVGAFSCAFTAFALDTLALFTDGMALGIGASTMSCNCFAEDLGGD